MSDALLALGEDSLQPRRQRYGREFKRQVVEQSLQPGASAAQVARAYELNGNLLHTWCEFPAHRSHFVFGVMEPGYFRRNGAARFPA